MKSNNIILIIIFSVIGLILFNVKGTFSESKQLQENPYKAKENMEMIPKGIKEKATDKIEETATSFFDKFKDKLLSNSEEKSSNELPKNYFPISKSYELEIVNHKAFTLGYSEKHEQAAWTFHKLTKKNTYGEASRRNLNFEPDVKVSTQSALSSDYSRSGFDRGHLVPAGDFKCCQDLLEDTFWVSNLSPQDQDFNRNIWNNLEQAVRNWARKNNELYVFTGSILTNDLPKIGRYNKISVPKFFYKIIVLQNSDISKTQVKAYLIPNEPGLGYNFQQYAVSVDEIEKKTKLDFLSILPDTVENKIESVATTVRW